MIMLGEEPPYLPVGTEVSAKYKGAFCEAKVRKVDRVVKCKVAFKQGFGSHTVLDNQIKGLLRTGSHVEARHPEKKEIAEGTITKIQDCSQYTVVFDDGDITTLRRSALCLKSGRHFAESETLDQLPLTHPEHFGNPVVGRRGTRRRLGSDDSSEDEEEPRKGKPIEEREAEIGKVVCVEMNEKKKAKDNWFPGLVVAPNATDTVRIRVKEEFLVRSFKDARYYTVPKKEATEFTREIGQKVENNTLKAAVEKALTFLDKDELPPHWDREQLFSVANSDDSDSDGALDTDSSDDEPREEKDHFVAQLYKFMDDRGTPINVCPSVCSRDLDLYKLFKIVNKMNGYNRVSNHNQWKLVSIKLGFGATPQSASQVKQAYKRYLHSFEDLNRKLGCTMVNHPRPGRSRSRTGRTLIREKDRSTPIKMEPMAAGTSKKDDDEPQDSPAISEPKKTQVVKEEEPPKTRSRPDEAKKPKEEEKEAETPMDAEPTRPLSNLRKKFPTLKAATRTRDEQARTKDDTPKTKEDPSKTKDESPRAKDEMPVLKRRAETRSESRASSSRPKRILRESSIDDGRTSGEESTKTSQGSDEQRSTTRAKSKQMEKKDLEESRRPKSTKGSDSDCSKKSKTSATGPPNAGTNSEDPKKPPEAVAGGSANKGKRPASEDPSTKRNGKRRNTETSADDPPTRPCLASNKSVLVGDVLKVYYGSSKDSNCIYEAKVIEVAQTNGETMYRVHYAGWNSRYDEWIQRDRIADNLSWTTRRTKTPVNKGTRSNTSTGASASASASASTSSVKRKPPPPGKGEQPTRSTTPSSITSSSSRTKSPATPVSTRRRIVRRDRPAFAAGMTNLRRTRRNSGHTEMSVDSQSDSETEHEDSESEAEEKPVLPPAVEIKKEETTPTPVKKLGMRTRPAKKPPAEPPAEVVEKKKPRLVKSAIKIEKESPKVSDSPVTQSKSSVTPTKPIVSDEIDDGREPGELTMEDVVKIEESSPKGRDFDLNEIRSELKGIVKVNAETEKAAESEESVEQETQEPTAEVPPPEEPVEEEPPVPAPVVKEETPEPEAKPVPVEEVKVEPEIVEEPPTLPPAVEEKSAPPPPEDAKEDIYEFKEPEPFDFQEVRRPIRIFDEIERSPEKQVVKTVVPSPTPLRATYEKRAVSPQEDIKNRYRSVIGKKIKEEEEKSVVEAEKTEEERSPMKEAPHLEIEVLQPPPLLVEVAVEDVEAPKLDEPEKETTSPHKQSPEPPCLVPVTEAEPFLSSELNSMLRSEEPPRLTMETSSSDSEGDERLIIANDDESTSNDTKVETHPLPPVLGVEPRREVKRSPLADIRFKRSEDRLKAAIPLPEPPKEPSPVKPCTSSQRAQAPEKPMEAESLSGIRSLVCDEVIPGSPGPKDQQDELPFQAPPASVLENTPPTTPPTTPDSNVSSPREDRVGRHYQSMDLSSLDNESSKSHRDSSEEMDAQSLRNRGQKYEKRHEKKILESPKKKRSRRRCESTSEGSKRMSGSLSGRGGGRARLGGAGADSDSDDTSENSQTLLHVASHDPLASSRSPKPSKYNFCKEMAPDMDSNQRISFLQHQLQELKKAYGNVKSQLASIDRRRKKLRRKDREEKLAGAAAAAAAAAAAQAAAAQAALAAKTQEVPSQ